MPKGKSRNAPFIAIARAQSAALAEEIEAMDADIQKRTEARSKKIEIKGQLDAIITGLVGKKRAEKDTPRARGFVKPTETHAPEVSPYFGLALPSASAKCLEISHQRMTAREIWASLEAAGVTSTASSPVGRVMWELRKRAEKEGDVILTGGGKWAFAKYVTDDEMKEIRRNLNGQPGRDSELHSAKTKAGMQNLKDRGVRVGAQLKMTEEKIAELKKLIASGMTARAASKQVGISTATFANYKKAGKLGILPRPRRRRAAKEAPHDLLTRTNGSLN